LNTLSQIIDSFEELPFSTYKLPMITIYQSPKDFKGKFVSRLFDINRPTRFITIKDNLEDARNSIPKNLHRLDRQQYDDPIIVEVWV
jgi:hypothetical protein